MEMFFASRDYYFHLELKLKSPVLVDACSRKTQKSKRNKELGFSRDLVFFIRMYKILNTFHRQINTHKYVLFH